MNQNKKDGQPGSQFDSGFGGTMFGGGNTQFGGTNAAGPAGGQTQGGFGAGSGAGGGGTNAGEFASGFGGTNAVSQIFREGGFGGDDRRKKFLIAGAVLAAVAAIAAVYFLFVQEKTPPTETPVAAAEDKDAAAGEEGEEGAATDEEEEYAEEEGADGAAAEEGSAESTDGAAGESAAGAPAGGAAPVVSGSSSYDYNEEAGGPVINAPAGSVIEVSRRADFSNRYVTGTVGQAGTFRIPNPPPGKVFWRIQGGGTANQITINPPVGLGIQFQAPANISEGGQLTWTATGPSAYFRVEFASDPSFASVAHVISTNQMAAPVTGVSAGSYFVRIGGLNRAAGKWEFSQGSKVDVQ